MPLSPEEHTILVSGATGQQGGAVARHLMDRGFHVRALTRDAGRDAARALADRGAEVVEGNFDDRESLDRALDDVDGAFSVQTFFEEGVEAETRHGKTFADAALDAEVDHFVYSSVGGAERESGVPHFESKWRVEEHVRSVGLPATILRPVSFMENWAHTQRESILDGRLAQPLDPATTLQQITVDDIGGFAALAFSDPDAWIGRALEIAGDELSMTETADAFGRALDRDVEYVRVPWEAFEERAGEELTRMYRWFEEEGYRADVEALREVYPGLTDFGAFLRRQEWIRKARGAEGEPDRV